MITNHITADQALGLAQGAIEAHKKEVAQQCEKAITEIFGAISRLAKQGLYNLSWDLSTKSTRDAPGSPLSSIVCWNDTANCPSEHMQFVIEKLKEGKFRVDVTKSNFFVSWAQPRSDTVNLSGR